MADEGSDFAAAPKVVKPKNKYKEREQQEVEEDEIKLIYNNLMWDKRVVRGNTYSALVTTSKNVDMPYSNTKGQKFQSIQRQEPQEFEQMGNRRANIQIFTDQHVESLTDKPPRYQYGAQTQFVIEKQVVRHRMPDKIGDDVETQIWDNQLFDFDYQVEPLLSVLCARTLQISRMEVLQEEELSIMRNRQLELHLEEAQEKNKIKNMYQLEEKLQNQNMKRLQNYRRERQKKVHTHQRVFSRVISKTYLKNLSQNTVSYVEGQGFFRNEVEQQLVQRFLPSLYSDSLQEQSQIDQWRNQAKELIDAAHQLAIKEHKWAKEVERTQREKTLAGRAEKAREKGERKLMTQELKYMIKFLEEEKVELARLEEQRKKAEEEGQEQPDE